jgi:hypothetical protein
MEWFQRLSDYYEAIAKYLDPDNTIFGKLEPTNPQEGLLAYANGTDWDPGSGAGYYRRSGPVWEYASAISVSTYVALAAFNDHSGRHENAGADEISVAGLSGLLADGQTPLAHNTSHQNAGADEISVAGLSGELADNQPALTHGNERHEPSSIFPIGSVYANLTGDDPSILLGYGSWYLVTTL